MTATIVKRLMTAVPGKDMFMYPMGDIIAENAARARGAGLPFDPDGVGAYVRIMDDLLDWVAQHRVFDVRGVWHEAMNAVPLDPLSPHVGWRDKDGGAVTTAGPVDLPFASPPRIGIEGLYVIEDTAAIIVKHHTDYTYGHKFVELHVDAEGDINCEWGTVVYADGDSWKWWLSFKTVMPQATRFRESMDPEEWRQLAWATRWTSVSGAEQGFADAVAQSYRTAASVLLINALVQADPTIMRTENTPKPLIKANRKRGKRTPKGRSWIDLDGVKYNGRSGSWSGRRTSTGVSWHQVRGHWRKLSSERFTNKQGQRVWVRPHTKGSDTAGRSTTPYRMKRGA